MCRLLPLCRSNDFLIPFLFSFTSLKLVGAAVQDFDSYFINQWQQVEVVLVQTEPPPPPPRHLKDEPGGPKLAGAVLLFVAGVIEMPHLITALAANDGDPFEAESAISPLWVVLTEAIS